MLSNFSCQIKKQIAKETNLAMSLYIVQTPVAKTHIDIESS